MDAAPTAIKPDYSLASRDVRGNYSSADCYPMGGKRKLKIITVKEGSGTLVTSARGITSEGGSWFETHRVYVDFYEQVAVAKLRCTKTNVQAQHKAVDVSAVMARAVAFYATKNFVKG